MPDSWRTVVAAVLPGPAPRIIDTVAGRWAGANIYLPRRIARLRWRGPAPRGSAECFAADLHDAVMEGGGTSGDARCILAALVGRRFVV